jgi:DNA (cytosine-5)-methyltransferase 1
MNYYNEHDPKAAAWLRELIGGGHIPNGIVDERSITEVKPHELTQYTQQHFFAGIGGWSLALKLAGWPEDRPVRTGSCPCQPFSVAGQGKGESDERHLWPVFRDIITFGDSTVTFGEQVASKAGREWLAGIRTDLEGLGYELGAADLCAASAGAPHIRQRLFWVADTNNIQQHGGGRARHGRGQSPDGGPVSGLAGSNRDGFGSSSRGKFHHAEYHAEPRGELRGMGNADMSGRGAQCGAVTIPPQQPTAELRGNAWDSFDILPCTDGKARRVESGTFPLAYGVSGRVGLLRGYGNAIVPQVAAQFILAYLDTITLSPRRVTELKPRP